MPTVGHLLSVSTELNFPVEWFNKRAISSYLGLKGSLNENDNENKETITESYPTSSIFAKQVFAAQYHLPLGKLINKFQMWYFIFFF